MAVTAKEMKTLLSAGARATNGMGTYMPQESFERLFPNLAQYTWDTILEKKREEGIQGLNYCKDIEQYLPSLVGYYCKNCNNKSLTKAYRLLFTEYVNKNDVFVIVGFGKKEGQKVMCIGTMVLYYRKGSDGYSGYIAGYYKEYVKDIDKIFNGIFGK